MTKRVSLLSLLFLTGLFSVMLSGCGEKQDNPEQTVKDMQSQNKPQQEMPENLKNRGMSRGGGGKGGQ
ncbi:MAG: hypothetical protein KF784_02555 [Fimbriimonadaceae bacterium]|nr:hypothetical protein [Fimbriimonadaceae bacterium]